MIYECLKGHVSVFISSIVQRAIPCAIEDIGNIYFGFDFIQVLDKSISLMLVTSIDKLEHELFFCKVSSNTNHIRATCSHDPPLVVWLAISCQTLGVFSVANQP